MLVLVVNKYGRVKERDDTYELSALDVIAALGNV